MEDCESEGDNEEGEMKEDDDHENHG